MKPIYLLSLLPLALAKQKDNPPPTTQLHDPHLPIYLGEVFWPPVMTFLAFLPPPATSKHTSETYWCWSALDVTNQILFNLGGINNLQVENYFDDQAYLTREGERWADCHVTPESHRMGTCKGVEDWDCIGGQRYTGPGIRKWSCWPNDMEAAVKEYEGRLMIIESKRNKNRTVPALGDDGLTSTKEVKATETKVVTGAMASSDIIGGFEPKVTGI
ncbi:hypothetical protein GLAREA_12895 [Glarea lozoyensis ATCC 20868]|uniref:Uncharacterized protein n=1 Tax=Glarea lozoyensis (strain ATCC 20868 / MF5171) TaxID=1116229 RepID=S3CUU4_GLAL2|nr:uncharacterized protein GLAREA_12895 [Glarea lozoyensis ATCC 20868]EPE30172.1 hypothetical protein GLAREA_12895 [Glarea lozoyensis ATCC 20868]